MRIGKFDTDKEVFLIAELGNNHEGSYSFAEEMVGAAAAAGANAVKFQTIRPEALVSVTQKDRVSQLEKLCLKEADFEKLNKVAESEGVLFLSTPFDLESVDFLCPLVPAFKISSGDNNFFPLLEKVAGTGKPILLSTGMTGMKEIEHSKQFIERAWLQKKNTSELALLHCVASYPTPRQAAHLGCIEELKRFGVTVGYSDHTLGIEAAVASVAVGARIIEKHFTLDKTKTSFRDHYLSADPLDFMEMADKIHGILELLGAGGKKVFDVEAESATRARRSIVAARNLPAGTVLSSSDLTWVRPGTGLAPGSETLLLGKKLGHPIAKGELILERDVEACAA